MLIWCSGGAQSAAGHAERLEQELGETTELLELAESAEQSSVAEMLQVRASGRFCCYQPFLVSPGGAPCLRRHRIAC